MKFIDIFDLSKYLKRTGDNQTARIGHVNAVIEQVNSLAGGSTTVIAQENFALEGTQYLFVQANGTDIENAQELQAAYDLAKTMSPTTGNRIIVIAAPGYYNFGSVFLMDTEFIDLVSLDGNRSIVFNGTETISIIANDIFVKGVDVQNKQFATDFNLNLLKVENCKGGDGSFGGYTEASGIFINCEGGDYSFGGLANASGYFKGCQGGIFSFGGGGISSGIFEECKATSYSFGGEGIANGTYTRCIADYGSFGDSEFLGNMSFCELKSGIYPPINFVEGNENDPLSCPAELPEGVTEEQFMTTLFGPDLKYLEVYDKDFPAEDLGGDPGDPDINPYNDLLNLLKVIYFGDPFCIFSGGNIITPNASIKASIDGLGLFYPQIGKVTFSLNAGQYFFDTSPNPAIISQIQLTFEQIQVQVSPILNQLGQDLLNHTSDAAPLIFQTITQIEEQPYTPSPTLPSGYTEEQLIQEVGLTDFWDYIGLVSDAYNEVYEENENFQQDLIEILSGVIIEDGDLSNVESELQQLVSDLEMFIGDGIPSILQAIGALESLL